MNSQWTVRGDEVGSRLDKFLAAPARLGSRGRAVAALERGKVLVNGDEVGIPEAAQRLVDGDVVRVWMDRPGSAKRKLGAIDLGDDLRILHEDEQLLVMNKPAGLLAVPLDSRRDVLSIVDRLQDHFRSHRKLKPLVVHRIDRDTSGLVVFAKDPHTQQQLKAQFRAREPERVYWAAVHGHPQPEAGTWRDHLIWDEDDLAQKASHARNPRAKEAISDYRTLERSRDAAVLEVRLKTGRQNQIRIQAALHGHPLIGERKYVADQHPPQPPRTPFPRQALHAWKLTFRHPKDGRPLTFEAPLPTDLTELLARLRRAK
jgi:23S rRNA pseudouridine1911/1915/1917 synthase